MEEFALCAVPSVFVLAIFGTIVVIRWFKHREIIALAEKGLLPEQYAKYVTASKGRGGRALLGWGIAAAALGLALVIGLWPLGFMVRVGRDSMMYPLGFGPWMLVGLIPLFVGVALLIFYFVTRKENGKVAKVTSPEREPLGE